MSGTYFFAEIKDWLYINFSISDFHLMVLVTGAVLIISSVTFIFYQREKTKRTREREQTKRGEAVANATVNVVKRIVSTPFSYIGKFAEKLKLTN